MFYTLIMQNRLMNIGWDKSKRIEDLTIEGSFHPKRDIDFENPIRDGKYFHFSIKEIRNWGVTSTTEENLTAKGRKEIGYFHIHNDERVYIAPTINVGDFIDHYDLIPYV